MIWFVILPAILAANTNGSIFNEFIDFEEISDIFGLSNCVEGKFL
jgi:hypothetical protein